MRPHDSERDTPAKYSTRVDYNRDNISRREGCFRIPLIRPHIIPNSTKAAVSLINGSLNTYVDRNPPRDHFIKVGTNRFNIVYCLILTTESEKCYKNLHRFSLYIVNNYKLHTPAIYTLLIKEYT